MWNVLTVPTVWYLTFPDNVECFYFSGSVVFYLFPTMWNVLTVQTVWNFNCPRQCVMFLLFLQCGILTVPNHVEGSYCSDSVVF